MKIKKSNKKLIATTLAITLVVLTIVSVAGATANLQSNKTTATDNTSSQLSNDEINDIVASLKSNNSGNVEQELDELMQRAILTGNDSLKQYVEYAKQAYELQTQLDSVNASMSALMKTNSSLQSVDTQLKQDSENAVEYSEVASLLSQSAQGLLSSLDDSAWQKLQDQLVEVGNIVSQRADISTISQGERNVIEIILLQGAVDNQVITGDQANVATETIKAALTSLTSMERQKYTTEEYNNLRSGSQSFANSTKNGKVADAQQIVMLNKSYKLSNPAIMYNGELLAAIDDLYKYVNATVQFTENKNTMAIQSNAILLELASGQSTAYVNDKPKNIPVPVLNINGKVYLTVSTFADVYGISYEYAKDNGVIVLYSDAKDIVSNSSTNQITNTSK